MGLILGFFLSCVAGIATYFGVYNFLQAITFPQTVSLTHSLIVDVDSAIREAGIGLGIAVGSVTLAIVLTLGNVRDTLRRRNEEPTQESERPTLAA
jgi:ABC-type phosphate transport system permease subunit